MVCPGVLSSVSSGCAVAVEAVRAMDGCSKQSSGGRGWPCYGVVRILSECFVGMWSGGYVAVSIKSTAMILDG